MSTGHKYSLIVFSLVNDKIGCWIIRHYPPHPYCYCTPVVCIIKTEHLEYIGKRNRNKYISQNAEYSSSMLTIKKANFWCPFLRRRIGKDLSNTFAKLEKLTICKCSFNSINNVLQELYLCVISPKVLILYAVILMF